MRRLVLLFLLIAAACDLSGCSAVSNSSASSGGGTPLPPISVAITGSVSTINAAGASVTISANVSNDPSGEGVRWFLQVQTPTGSPISCSPTCGTLSSATPTSVVYTPPPTVPGTLILPGNTTATNFASPMLTAIAVADNRQNASDPFTIQGTSGQVLGVQISNPITTIGTGGNAITLGVNLTNDVNNLGVTWSLTQFGAPCAGNLTNINSLCGALINVTPFSAVYVAPPTPTITTSLPTITVTANSDITKSATDPFTVVKSATPNKLMGQLAFRLNGFDSNGKPVALAGSFTADGSGNITGGAMDVNDNQLLSSITNSLNGFYYIDQNSRGNIAFTTLLGSGTLSPPTFAYTLSSDATHGTLIGFDNNNSNNLLISGIFAAQDPTAFSLHGINNDYIFKLESNLPDRYDAVGKISIDLDTKVNVFIDTSRVAIGPSLVNAEYLGALLNPPDSNGRGTINLGPFNFVYYVVNSNLLFLVQSDPGTISNALFSGVVKFQNIQSFTPATINATSVFSVTGLSTTAFSSGPSVSAGTITISGQTNANLLWDSDNSGNLVSQITVTGQSVIFSDPTLRTGRGTITVSNGHANGLADSFVFYLADSGDGFLLDTTAGADNRALVGDLVAQSGAGSFSNLSLSANLLLDSGGSSLLAIPNVAGSVAPSNGSFTGLVDLTSPASSKIPLTAVLAPNQSISGTYSVLDANSGRATATVPGAFFGNTDPVQAVFYLIAPNQAVLLGAQQGLVSGATTLTPQ